MKTEWIEQELDSLSPAPDKISPPESKESNDDDNRHKTTSEQFGEWFKTQFDE